MAEKRLTRVEAKARTREQLLDAAARVFAAKGFAGASVEEIAAEAGFSIGALYSNFAGKEDLFLALMSERAATRISDTATTLADWHDGAGQPWRAFGQQMAEVADKDMNLAPLQAEFWLYAIRHPPVMATFAENVRHRLSDLEDVIAVEVAREDGDYPEDLPARLAVVVSALFTGMVRQRRIDPESAPPELYGDALRWLFRGAKNE